MYYYLCYFFKNDVVSVAHISIIKNYWKSGRSQNFSYSKSYTIYRFVMGSNESPTARYS